MKWVAAKCWSDGLFYITIPQKIFIYPYASEKRIQDDAGREDVDCDRQHHLMICTQYYAVQSPLLALDEN